MKIIDYLSLTRNSFSGVIIFISSPNMLNSDSSSKLCPSKFSAVTSPCTSLQAAMFGTPRPLTLLATPFNFSRGMADGRLMWSCLLHLEKRELISFQVSSNYLKEQVCWESQHKNLQLFICTNPQV